MEIIYFNELKSTQLYLTDEIKSKRLTPPIAVVAKRQTDGIGSRDNSWEGGEGNLLFSFATKELPEDLPLASASIYFSFIMKEILAEYIDDVWLKWPNDLYYLKSKVGGTVTKIVGDTLICGMGVNLKRGANSFDALDINISIESLLESYFKKVKSSISWKELFSKYEIEFNKNRGVSTHINGEHKSLENAILLEDGSLIVNNKRVYSLR